MRSGICPFFFALVGIFAVALTAACSGEDPGGHGDRCPPGATYDSERERCISDGSIDDPTASADTDAGGGGAKDVSSPELDTAPGEDEDTGSETDLGADADTGSADEEDAGGADESDTGDEPDSGSGGDPDTGEPPECGGDLWDSTHDGENPWEEPLIDCNDLDVSWDCSLSDDEQEVLELVNEMRSEEQDCGFDEPHSPVEPLEMDFGLQCAARIHSWDQQGRGFYDHDTPEGVTASERASLVSTWGSAGENIHNFTGTPEGVVQGWMNSPGHCRNIMRSHYVAAGVGRYGGFYTIKFAGSGFSW